MKKNNFYACLINSRLSRIPVLSAAFSGNSYFY